MRGAIHSARTSPGAESRPSGGTAGREVMAAASRAGDFAAQEHALVPVQRSVGGPPGRRAPRPVDAYDVTNVQADNGRPSPQAPAGRNAPQRPVPSLRVENPEAGIPEDNPNGLLCQSNGSAVEQQLRELCPEGNPQVDPRTGQVSMGPVSGGPHAQTCGMLADMTRPRNDWTIALDDRHMPATSPDNHRNGANGRGSGGRIVTESPNGAQYGYAATDGQMVDIPPSAALGHELLGHAGLVDRGREPMLRTARARGGHDGAVARENLMNREQGRPQRGANLDPYCGESYVRERGGPRFPSLGRCEAARAETHPETPITQAVPPEARQRPR
jgi:hypothetical protein